MYLQDLRIPNLYLRVLGILLLYTLVRPQTTGGQVSKLPFIHLYQYSKKNGLISNNISATLVDSKGFLWIATENGLQRFNGYEFELYQHIPGDDLSLINNNVAKLFEDKHHNIWIGTLNGVSIFSYKTGKFTSYTHSIFKGQKCNIGEVASFLHDSKGQYWLGTIGDGLLKWDNKIKAFINIPDIHHAGSMFKWVTKLQETQQHEIVFPVTNGFEIIQPSGQQTFYPIPKPKGALATWPMNMIQLLPQYPDEIWISPSFESHYTQGGKGLYCYNRTTNEWKRYECSDEKIASNIFGAAVNWDAENWLLSNHQLCLFNHRKKTFSPLQSLTNQLPNSLHYLETNPDNSIWMSTGSDGLFLLHRSNILFDSIISDEKSNGMALFYDTSFHTYFGIKPYFSHELYIRHDTEKNGKLYALPYFKQHPRYVGLNLLYYQDILYICTGRGLWKYDKVKNKLDSLQLYEAGKLITNHAVNNAVGYNQKIYVSGKGCGPLMYDVGSNTLENLKLYPGELEACAVVFISRTGILYTSFTNVWDTLYAINLNTGEKTKFPFPKEFHHNEHMCIHSFAEDNQHRIWCGTNNYGIAVLNTKLAKWEKFLTPKQGFTSLSCQNLVFDKRGVIWCQTNEELFLIHTKNFSFRRYVINEGMGDKALSGFLEPLNDSQQVFVNDGQIFKLSDKLLNTQTDIVPITIYNVKVAGNKITDTFQMNDTAHLNLAPYQDYFSLNFAARTLHHENAMQYSYYLKGIDEKLKVVGRTHFLSYNNLSPGSYWLYIQGANSDSSILSKQKIVHVVVEPAWFQTILFKMACLLLAIGLLMFLVRFYLKRKLLIQQVDLEKKLALSKERSRIAADMHDDLGVGISRIRFISADLQKQLNEQNIQHSFDQIIHTSDDLVDKMNEIIWALDSADESLADVLYYIRSQCSEMLDNASIKVLFSIPEKIPDIVWQGKQKRNLYLLVKEAVHNIIKHAKASEVNIKVDVMSQLICIDVIDNGIGLSETIKNKSGHGLANFNNRAAAIGGTVKIHSSNKGTHIRFEIPW
ncbi:MAG TPA: two-component regulator propeller domain-containing protein [Chitinophagaceae bacterium]|nr:two-component regulator propeller domain-containing protein [Chitinophagaceae bacterium]